MSTDFITSSAHDIASGVRAGKVSAEQVAAACCDNLERRDGAIHAMLHYDRAAVLAQARRVDGDARLRAGRLAGVPVVVKDNIQVEGMPLTCGSKILGTYQSKYTATAVERLLHEGAIVIGKTNLDEFAMGSSCEWSAFGPTRNPWDASRVPGGSSGGSAAAVSAGYAPIGLGSETGGSVRQPASLCGNVGYKPTYGTVSRYGLVAFSSSLDQIGPFARTVADTALTLSVMSGADGNDSTSIHASGWAVESAAWKPLESARGLRIGVVPGHFAEGVEPDVAASVRAVIARLKDAGAEIVDLSLPMSNFGVQIYYILATSEASSNLSRFDGVRYGDRKGGGTLAELYMHTRGQGFGPEVKRRIMLGTFALSSGYQDAYYKRAIAAKQALVREYQECFTTCDVIIGPTSPQVAFPLGANLADPLAMYLCDLYTIPANLAGSPAVSVPCGVTPAGLPIGVQLQGPVRGDWKLLSVAALVERLLALGPRIAPHPAKGQPA